MAYANYPLCENCTTIPPACENILSKLDIVGRAASAQYLTSEQISTVRENLRSQIVDLKQLIKSDQDYLQSLKDDLIVCKDKIAIIEAWEVSFEKLDSVLPVIKKPTALLVNKTQQPYPSTSGIMPNSAAMVPKKGGVPTFRFIEEQEWDNVPSYLKLRLKLEQINGFVEALNRELTVKYTLLKKKKATLKKTELTSWANYMALETAETKGSYFVVASDLKKHGFPEKTVSNMCTILRHCRHMRELRTGKTIRLLVTN